MIHITEHKFGYTVEGHAGYAEAGSDIVCAAVSCLAQAVARVLVSEFKANTIIKDGYLDVNCISTDEVSLIVESVFWVGVAEIAEQYPNHVKIRRMKRGIHQ